MPLYRKNSDSAGGNWVSIANLYRKNSDTAGGNWVKLKRLYRKNSDSAGGNWVIVHDSDSLTPYYTVAPTLESNAYNPAIFFDGSTLTLTRGTWENVGSAYSPVSYSLKIQYSTDQTNWTDAATGTGTTLTYTISLSDVRSPSYYFRGRVQATNVNGTTTYNTGSTRSEMDLSVTSINASVINNQISAVWTYNKSNNSSNISSQQINVRTNVAYTYNGNYYNAYSVVHTFSVPPGTGSSLFGISGTNIKPSTSIYVEIVGTANDSAGTQASDYSADFTSPILVGTVDISPSFSELDGYRRVESDSTVSAVPSGWPSGTTFTYEWERTRSFQPADSLVIGNGSSVTVPSSSSITGERISVTIYGTYEGQTSNAVFSTQHRIIPAPPSFSLSGAGGITISNVSATGGEFYFGTYSGPSSGTIPQTAIGTNYSVTGLSAGTYTVTLFSRAINGLSGYEVTTESNSSTSQNVSVTAFSGASSTSIISMSRYDNSNVTGIISFSGATGPYYQLYWTTGTVPTTSSYDAAGTSSSQIYDVFNPSADYTYYFYVRSSKINRGDTTTAGTESNPSDYSEYGPSSNAASYSFTNPTGGSASISGGSTAGSQLTLTRTNATGSPDPTGIDWVWRRADGGFGGNTFTGGTILQSGGTTYTTTSNDAGYSVRVEINWNNGVGTQSANSNLITVTALQYTVTWDANGGSVSPSSSTVNSGSSVTAPTPTRSGHTFNGWYNASAGGSFIVGAGNSYTVTASQTLYAQWTLTFVTPSAPAPSLQFQRTSSIIRWYCDYPSPSGSWSSIQGMQFEIRTSPGGGTLLASGTRSFPGFGVYPYNVGGINWAFRMGTQDGDITYNSAARYGRARVVLTGTNGSTYFGNWSSWI